MSNQRSTKKLLQLNLPSDQWTIPLRKFKLVSEETPQAKKVREKKL